jgi:hypothetical protein
MIMEIPDPLLIVARHLGDLRQRVVFVGGMIRSLLVTDPAAGGARPTDDVDLIIEAPTRAAYYALNESLRKLDFREANEEGAPLCRWTVEGIRVDVMPIDPAILGFSNVWYAGAHGSSLTIETSGGAIQILDAPHFCATKLEAFFSRGNGDLYHHDIEDFIAVIDGRPTLIAEIGAAPEELREFLAHETSGLVGRADFVEAMPAHLNGDAASQSRLPLVMSRLREIAALAARAQATPTSVPKGLAANARRRRGAASISAFGPALPLDHVFARSTNLHSASYDSATSTLTILFRSGRVYAYDAVPPAVYAGLRSAASAGRYLNIWIKDRFPARQLR